MDVPSRLPVARKSSFPDRIAPQLARATAVPPSGSGWVHEIKQDGHRLLAFLDRGAVRLQTRNGHDGSRRYASIAGVLYELPVRQAIFDGEVAVPDERGVTHIAQLERALISGGGSLACYVFDLLFLNGRDLRHLPLLQRR